MVYREGDDYSALAPPPSSAVKWRARQMRLFDQHVWLTIDAQTWFDARTEASRRLGVEPHWIECERM